MVTEIEYVYKGQPVKVEPSKFHTWVDHNFWIDRIGKCPYCHNGSKPVDKNLIIDRLEK